MDALIESFESGHVDNGAFHHRDHVRLAWTYLRELSFPAGAQRFTEALQRFAAANGKPQLYHATITWVYLVTIHDRMSAPSATGARQDRWEAFAAENPDLLTWKPSIIEALYKPETIASEHARRIFVLPDQLRFSQSAIPPATTTNPG
jgi:hypothetical protein